MSSILLQPSRKYPAIPGVGNDLTSHTRVLEALREAVQTHERRNADRLASFVRVQDLIDLGAARLVGKNRLEWLGSSSGGGGATALADLTDVDLTGIVDGDFIQYEQSSGLWLPVAAPSGGGSASGVRLRQSTGQSMSGGVDTLTWDTEDFDTDSYHDNSTNPSRITAPATGTYWIYASVAWSSGGFNDIEIWLNGTTVIGIVGFSIALGGGARCNVGTLYQLTAGDYIQIKCIQTGGGTTVTTSHGTQVCMFKV